MRNRFSFTFFLAALLTAVTVLGIAAIPSVLFEQEDNMLYHFTLERHRETGRLAPEGEDLYLVRTLYARSELLQNKDNGYIRTAPDLNALRRQITSALNEMAKTGILPAALSAELGIIAERDYSLSAYYEDAAGFLQAVFSGEEHDTVASFGFELEPRTGFIVNAWIHSSGDLAEFTAGYDAASAMEAYQSWLGLHELDDWQKEEASYYNYEQSSQKGNLKLYLLLEGGMLQLGAATLSVSASP